MKQRKSNGTQIARPVQRVNRFRGKPVQKRGV